MKKFTTLMGSAALLAVSSVSHSAEEGSGCGVGSLLLDGQSGKGSHIVAAIVNGLLPNTFTMTTGGGVLGCDPTQAVEVDVIRETFVAQNMDQLTTETAKGSGEYLTVLAALMGVPQSEVPHFTDLAQSHFDALFVKGNDAADVIASLQGAMANDQQLAPFAIN